MKEKIINVNATEILDSRGNPTIETTVTLSCGIEGCASVPSGASVGKFEAHERRDGDKSRYNGKGVLSCIASVRGEIRNTVCGMEPDFHGIDAALIELDGTKNKSRLGANTILSVSLASARSAASAMGVELYEYLSENKKPSLPSPMLNIMNGGAHAKNNLEIQEFMIVITGGDSFAEKMRISVEIYKELGKILDKNGYSTAVGDEGGYAPNLGSDEEALELICSAVKQAGYGENSVKLALDVASSDWYKNGVYKMSKSGVEWDAEELIGYYERLCERYPIISIEDGVGEEDLEGWRKLTERLSDRIMLVGDDLFVTNEERVQLGIEKKIANAVLIKPNQIGTLSQTLKVIELCKRMGYKTIISHRSGDTEDSFIADLAVATASPFIKTGAPTRGERTAKYNRLLHIEQRLKETKS